MIDCLAYVQSCNVKLTKVGKPFATFYLKDKNANMITARLFDISHDTAQMVQLFARRPVKLRAEVQIFGGSFSLIIDGDTGITVYNGDFDYASFVGSYEVSLDTAAIIYNKVMNDTMPVEMYSKLSVDFLGAGRVGAFAKIYDLALSNITFLEGLNGLDTKDLFKVFFVVMHNYYLILNHHNTFGSLEKLKLIDDYNAVRCDEDLKFIVIDTLRSICENTKPMHLYAHLIKNAVMQANKTLQLVNANSVLVSAASTQVYYTDLLGNSANEGGVELLKY